MKPNIFSIILNVGTAVVVAALAYASFQSATVAWSVGICVAIGVVVYAFSKLPEPKKVARSEETSSTTRSPAAQAAVVVAVIFGLAPWLGAPPSLMLALLCAALLLIKPGILTDIAGLVLLVAGACGWLPCNCVPS